MNLSWKWRGPRQVADNVTSGPNYLFLRQIGGTWWSYGSECTCMRGTAAAADLRGSSKYSNETLTVEAEKGSMRTLIGFGWIVSKLCGDVLALGKREGELNSYTQRWICSDEHWGSKVVGCTGQRFLFFSTEPGCTLCNQALRGNRYVTEEHRGFPWRLFATGRPWNAVCWQNILFQWDFLEHFCFVWILFRCTVRITESGPKMNSLCSIWTK